ncbi:Eukaryotic initiation factor 4a [Thalictrum thalictroides]|uniref:Eukaryotic initiation factor 4a n=1 Tax=Thalictrum thalictroides TaxID=46969 RepID=A0A7J6VZK5_THATH|nr:Eukaryotic initiation factor 4a [Thalictrum thalictroides]
MGEEEVFSIERAIQQHKDEIAAEIKLVSNSIHDINQKTDVILEELRKLRRGRVERALQQHKEETAAQIQLLKDSIHVVDQKTDLILEELQQCMNPIEVEGELIKQHKKETSAQIQLSTDSILAVEQKTDLILEETRQIGIAGEVSSSSVSTLMALLERGSPSSVPLEGMFLAPRKDMAGLAPEGLQFNAQPELVNADGHDSYESFKAMGLGKQKLRLGKEKLPRDVTFLYTYEKPCRRILPYWKRLSESRTRKVCSRDQVECQALVQAPAPTRELAQQIEKVMEALGGDYVGAKVHACLGARNGKVTFRKVSDLIPLAKSRNFYYLQELDINDLLEDLRPVLVPKVCQKKLTTPEGPKKPKKSQFRHEFSRRSKKSRISSSSHFKMYR